LALWRWENNKMDVSQSLASLIEIVWLDFLLSGDNAVMLALATRALPQELRRPGVLLGTALFILLRIVFAYALLAYAGLAGVGFLGAALLIWAAFRLGTRDEAAPPKAPRRTLSAALLACLGKDAPLALQNMVAVQAAAQGSLPLVQIGLALSIPLLALGSAQFITVLRKPPLLWAGAGLLGWLAGRLGVGDALVLASPLPQDALRDVAPPVVALLTLLAVYFFSRGRRLKGRKI
jgi:YjbE family integral membrane protein